MLCFIDKKRTCSKSLHSMWLRWNASVSFHLLYSPGNVQGLLAAKKHSRKTDHRLRFFSKRTELLPVKLHGG